MMHYSWSDVVLVAFSFANLQATKKRPAVVISSSDYHLNRPEVIIMAVTSRIHQPLTFGGCFIQEWESAGLLKPSVLKPLIATLEQTCIIKTLGRLSSKDQNSLSVTLNNLLKQCN